ncbi:hypothetical protein [Pedobacter nototheniae]|uniref:hypothetical protein n=1 Tax=Pedobacter nototheniae TaxID=2488994 RepID=UPI00292D8BFE|nr:hypothetical protein [Pedobacter nototheniae]
MNQSKLKIMQIMHLAFCMAVMLFLLLAVFITKDQLFFNANPATTSPFNPIFPIMGLASLSFALIGFKKAMSAMDATINTDSKLTRYQTAFIIKMAFLEAGALLNITVFFITHNLFFLVFALISLVGLIISRPTKEKIIESLNIQYPDTENL